MVINHLLNGMILQVVGRQTNSFLVNEKNPPRELCNIFHHDKKEKSSTQVGAFKRFPGGWYMGVNPKIVVPQNGWWFIMESPIKMDD